MDRIRNASLITAIKTPYLNNGNIDFKCFDSLVENQLKCGVNGLVIGGTTGEGHLMDWDEEIVLIAHAVHAFGKDMVIIGNTGSNNTREAVKATEQGFLVGMDAALQINPYYGKTSTAGLQAHFHTLLEVGPAIVYNVPGRTGQDMLPDMIEHIATHKNLVGIKECAGTERIKGYEAKGIPCWSGNDDEAHDSRHSAGSRGVISVTSHIIPKTIRYLMDNKDDALNQKIQPLFNWMFSEPNPIVLNTVLSMLGQIKPVFRLPYVPLCDKGRKTGIELLEGLTGLKDTFETIQDLENHDFIIL